MTTWSADKYFTNAKACFAENLEALPAPNLGMSRAGESLLFYNLSRGLHDLTCAVEKRLDDLDSRLRGLDAIRPPNR
jgi:hypothetical protein